MKTSYSERDYPFGQAILTLRTAIGLTQVELAHYLGVSRRAVVEWEAGGSYPKTEHLKKMITLGVEHRAFAAGQEAEEIRRLWKTARRKVLLDEQWLSVLLDQQRSRHLPVISPPAEETRSGSPIQASPGPKPRVDWGDALMVPAFYGREEEKTQLIQWVVQDRCRVVSVLGMGGIGKSALCVSIMHQISEHFEVVIFRPLRDTPSCETLLDDCLRVLSPEPKRHVPASLEQRISLFLEHLRKTRVLVVLDNLESLLQEGNVQGHLRPGFEGYGQLLRRVAETTHQSCLLLTSREKPAELRPLEGKHSHSLVRSLRLSALDRPACKQLLEEKELIGTEPEQERLIEAYGGNPLALKIVAETIFDLFAGEIGPFLAEEAVVFGSITDLLSEQFGRLSPLEQSVLCWLAIVRESVTLDELLALQVRSLPHVQMLEALDAGYRRSLIERGQRAGSFMLQSVVLEYVTLILITEGSREIQQCRLARLVGHGLSQAHAKEYVRQTRERLLVSPLLTELQSTYPSRARIEEQLLGLLDELRGQEDSAQGYGPANLVALLRLLRGHLRGLDLSQLCIRGAYFQGIEMQDASFVGTTLRETVFTEAFDVVKPVAISPDGKWWAAGTLRGEVRVWHEGGQSLHLVWQAHTDMLHALAFSPDGQTLASGSVDGTVKLWHLEQGALLWTGWHTDFVVNVAFAPHGRMLASCGTDAVIRLWEVTSGTNLQTLSGQGCTFYSLAWSPDGKLLASGSFDGSIRLWQMQETQPASCVAVLTGHTNWVWALAFSPDSTQLVSGSWDRTVKLWEVEGERCQTLREHTERVCTVTWSGDGRVVASAGFDRIISVFDVERGSYRTALHGHTAVVYCITFTSDSRGLLSSSEDGTMRVWDVASGQCVRVVEGCGVTLQDVAWSPESTRLASVGTDALVTIWDIAGKALPRILRGHSWHLFGVDWSPNGRLLASSGRDNTVRLWDPTTGDCVQVLQDPDHDDTLFYGVAWSPDGRLLACGSYMRGAQAWDTVTWTRCWVGPCPTRLRRVAWGPDGTRLAGSGDGGSVSLWAASDGTLLGKLPGHSGRATSVAWSPDGTRLASAGSGRDGGELFVWNVGSQGANSSGELVQTLKGHPGSVFAVAWSPTGEVLVSGGSDGTIRWWEAETGKCLRTCEGHDGGVWSIRVSPDGRLLASCGNDNTIRVWDLESASLVQTLRHDRPYERLNITAICGLNEAQKESLRALGAIEGPAH